MTKHPAAAWASDGIPPMTHDARGHSGLDASSVGHRVHRRCASGDRRRRPAVLPRLRRGGPASRRARRLGAGGLPIPRSGGWPSSSETTLGVLLLRGGPVARPGWVGVIGPPHRPVAVRLGFWLWSVPVLALLVPWRSSTGGSTADAHPRANAPHARRPAGEEVRHDQGTPRLRVVVWEQRASRRGGR